MDYFKEAEELLYSVPRKERALYTLRGRYARLVTKNIPRDAAAIDYAKPYTRATFTGDALNDLCELADVLRRIAETQSELDEIKQAVEAVPSEELKTCLRLWYFEGLPKETISERLGLWSRATVYNKRNEGVYEFARVYWGAAAEKALKNAPEQS